MQNLAADYKEIYLTYSLKNRKKCISTMLELP